MNSELLPWIFGAMLVFGAITFFYVRRLIFVKSCYRRLEEYSDTILQHFQGTVLNVQGILNDLDRQDRVRQRIEYALENADKRLAQIREQMQSLCSEQQDEALK